MFVIAIRLYYLQIDQKQAFARLGERNFLQTEVLPSQRGNVIDSNGNLLATNRPVFDLCWHGSGSFYLRVDQKNAVRKITSILGSNYLDKLLRKRIDQAERFSRQIVIKKDLSRDELSLISEQCAESTNLYIDQHFQRIYPYGKLASHILGYLRVMQRYEFEGKYGLERLFQNDLRGQDGYVQHVINATGKKLLQKDLKLAIPGSDVALTIDLSIQDIAERMFEPGQSGAFIVLDPHDGAIKAMVSYPNFDPNLFLQPISHAEWETQFSKDSPFLNRAVHALYPPASIFKLITFAAGLEEGVVTPETEFTCKGYTLFCKRKYFCQRRWGHGKMPALKSLAVSCNIPCYEIAQQIKIDQIAEYAIRFGLGQRTNFLLNDKAGLVPTTFWKQAHKGERWWPGETLSASIGQSFLLVTPLQIARMISAIFTGNLVKPRILLDESIEEHFLYVSRTTLDFLQSVMREAVQRGTARQFRKLKDFTIFAKTGTAQTVSLEHQKKEARGQLEHAWFASHFSYKDQKPLVMVVLVENAGSSRPAQNIAEKFLRLFEKSI